MLRKIILQLIVLSLLLSPFLLSQTTKGLRSQSSAHYQFFYEKRVSQGDIQLLSKALESNFELYRKKFNTGYFGKPRVYIVGSSQRLKNESHIAVYDDAAYNDGRLYVCLSCVKGESMQRSIPRIVARSVLGAIPACPSWLAEVYAIHAGSDYTLFGKPAQGTETSFSDLSEEFGRTPSGSNEVYAVLAATAKFIIDRYGEIKFESLFKQIRSGSSFEQACETSFGEKMNMIEREWAQFLRSQVKGG